MDIKSFYGVLRKRDRILEDMERRILAERKRSVLRDVHI
jgi:hypothetical protein